MENDYIVKVADNESLSFNNHLLLDEVGHNRENCQGRSLCCLPKPKAKADSTNQGLDNSRNHAKTKSNNWFIQQYSWIPVKNNPGKKTGYAL